jgi:murein DD-endopeptidase MepM/ murein hydrolase activator NlpD
VSPADGIITLAEDDLFYSGGTVIIDHGMGVSSTVMHMSKVHAHVGQKVKQSDLVGEVGATGRATGPHLDWRMNWYTTRIDPALIVGPMPQ